MILGRRRGGGLQAINFFKKTFVSTCRFTHVSVSHIMATFDIKCMFFNFFRWESIRYRQTAHLLLEASSMKNFQFWPFLHDNIYFLPHLVKHIKAILKRRIFFEILQQNEIQESINPIPCITVEEWDCLYVWGLTPTEKDSLEECGKLRQKAQTQNISHIIETTAKTACYFLLVGRNGRAQMEWSWKLQVRIREARAQAKSLFRVSDRHRYFTRKSQNKRKSLVNTDLNHRHTWINY